MDTPTKSLAKSKSKISYHFDANSPSIASEEEIKKLVYEILAPELVDEIIKLTMTSPNRRIRAHDGVYYVFP